MRVVPSQIGVVHLMGHSLSLKVEVSWLWNGTKMTFPSVRITTTNLIICAQDVLSLLGSFFRAAIPQDILDGTPTPSAWGVPSATLLNSSSCDIPSYFQSHRIVFGAYWSDKRIQSLKAFQISHSVVNGQVHLTHPQVVQEHATSGWPILRILL